MNKKDYKGYELIKAIHDGEIKDYTTIEVHDLSTLDHIKSKIEYSNKRLNWIAGEFDTTCLFDDNIYFRVLEDNTEEIEELEKEQEAIANPKTMLQEIRFYYDSNKMGDKINEIIRYIKRKDKNND